MALYLSVFTLLDWIVSRYGFEKRLRKIIFWTFSIGALCLVIWVSLSFVKNYDAAGAFILAGLFLALPIALLIWVRKSGG